MVPTFVRIKFCVYLLVPCTYTKVRCATVNPLKKQSLKCQCQSLHCKRGRCANDVKNFEKKWRENLEMMGMMMTAYFRENYSLIFSNFRELL